MSKDDSESLNCSSENSCQESDESKSQLSQIDEEDAAKKFTNERLVTSL